MVRYLRPRLTLRTLVPLAALAVALNFTLPPINPANAAAGDILVADLDAGGLPQSGPGRVIRLNNSGTETAAYSATDFREPSGIELATNGELLVVDAEAFGGAGGVIRLNPTTGAKVTDYRGGSFIEPTGVAVLSTGEILVADQDAFGGGCADPEAKSGCGGVIRVNPATGAQTRFDSGAAFWNPTDLAVAPDGTVLVVDLDWPSSGGPGRVVRLSSTGAFIIGYSLPEFDEPSGIAVDSAGEIFVVDAVGEGPGVVFRLSASGSKIRDYRGGSLDEPTGVVIAFNGDILVADQDAGGPFETGPGGVVRVNRDTAAQTTYFSGSFVNPSGIAVEPGTPPTGPGTTPTPGSRSCGGRTATLSGTDNKETLRGTPQADVIVGLGGADTIRGLAGHDRLCGGTGKDKISGGTGKDRLFGERGNDTLRGGKGADRLVGGKGRDTCIGGPGKDKASGCEVKVGIP